MKSNEPQSREKPLPYSALPKLLQKRFEHVRARISWLGISLDRDLIHISFARGGVEYWQKSGRRWRFLIGGYPEKSDLPSLLRAVA